MKNKFYYVYDLASYDQVINIVIAKNSRDAKNIGHGYDATEVADWTDLRVRAINHYFAGYDDERGEVTFRVSGKGFVYTDLEPQRDYTWELLVEELKKQERYELPEPIQEAFEL